MEEERGVVTVDIQEAAGHPALYDNFYLVSVSTRHKRPNLYLR